MGLIKSHHNFWTTYPPAKLPPVQNIGRKIAKGAAWMVLFKVTERGLGLISTIILARLLVPSDFGLIAMAMAVIAVLDLLGAFSFDMALIQNLSAERRHYDTVWTFNILFAVFCAALLVLIAEPMASFYAEPRLTSVMYWLALGTFVQGFENIGVVAFRKQMTFDKEFKFLFGKKIASVLVTVPLAFALNSYWALVVGILTGRFAGVLLSYMTQSYRPRFSLAGFQELFHFSKWMLLNNLLNFLRFRSANFIVGKLSGPHSLGLFTVAYEIANLPTTELCAPINRAVFPGFANISNDADAFRQSFISIAGVIALLSLPAAFGIGITSDILVPVMLGQDWSETVPLIQILAVNGALLAIQNNNGLAILALGKPGLLTYLGALSATILLPAIIVLTMYYGALGTALAFLGATILTLPLNYHYVLKLLDLRASQLLAELWRPIVSVVLMSIAVKFYMIAIATPQTISLQILHLLSAVTIGAVIYTAAIYLLWRTSGYPQGAEHHILTYLKQRLAKARIASSNQTL